MYEYASNQNNAHRNNNYRAQLSPSIKILEAKLLNVYWFEFVAMTVGGNEIAIRDERDKMAVLSTGL